MTGHVEYKDCFITCEDDELQIRWYYFPFGTKRVRYETIRGYWRFDRSVLRGRFRIWGTSNPRYWAGLDPCRPRKKGGLVIDTGRFVRAVVTPEDPDRVAAVLSEKTGIGVRVDNRTLFI